MRFWLILIAALVLAIPTAAFAQNSVKDKDEVDMSVVAEGSGAVVDNDLARAQDEALADAKKNAVEQGVGVFVSSQTLGKDYEVVEKTILTKSDGYLSSWSIVEGSRKVEKFEGNQILSIKITAKVKLLSLVSDLSDMEEVYNAMKRPKVMVLIKEENLGKPSEDLPLSALAIMSTLQDRKFDVVDPEVVKQLIQEESTRAAIERGDVKAAAALAMKKGAQILVLGTAKSSKISLEDLGNEARAASAMLSARIVYADTGEVLFTPSKSTDGKGVSVASDEEAGAKALENAGSRLISSNQARFTQQVVARWAKESSQGRVYRVVANNVKDAEFEALKDAIAGFRFHKDLLSDSFEAKTGTVEVRSGLSIDVFRKNLRAVKIKGKQIEISRMSGAVTELSLVK